METNTISKNGTNSKSQMNKGNILTSLMIFLICWLSFTEIDAQIIGTVNPNNASSSVSYNLGGRGHQSLPNARYDCQEDGIVIVEIRVDRDGRVTQADPGRPGSTSIVECLTRAAREAALATRFNPDPNAPAIQLGTITYNFILR